MLLNVLVGEIFPQLQSCKSKDEIGDLAGRINEMIVGLREHFHLQKFVSQQNRRCCPAGRFDGRKTRR